MTDADFLPAILESPGDDTPRLVYADWLDEQPDNWARLRAELIRVQCERARLPSNDVESSSTADPPPGHGRTLTIRLLCGGKGCRLILDDAVHSPGCRWECLRRREKELLTELWPRLSAQWRWPALPISRDSFRRGFVARLNLVAARDWTYSGHAVLAQHPVATVCLSDYLISRMDLSESREGPGLWDLGLRALAGPGSWGPTPLPEGWLLTVFGRPVSLEWLRRWPESILGAGQSVADVLGRPGLPVDLDVRPDGLWLGDNVRVDVVPAARIPGPPQSARGAR